MSRLWTPNRPLFAMAPYGALVGACRPKMQQPAAAPSSLLTDLVAYYKLEEASGTRVDATGRGNDLADNNTVGQAAGKVGNAASFARANSEYLSKADNADLSMGDIDFTIAAWVYLNSKPAAVMDLLSKWNGGLVPPSGEYRIIYNDTPDRYQFSVTDDGVIQTLLSADTLGSPATATWYLIVVWHDAIANTINIQANNGAVDSAVYSAGVYAGAADFEIGAHNGGTAEFFDGFIDELGIWKRVLTAAERTALYNGGSGITHPFTGT